MSALPSADEQARYMQLALDEAFKCEPTPSAFCVGAVIVKDSKFLSTGYSRELPGNTHAEQCAVDKLLSSHPDRGLEILKGSDIYTTMEPCSIRLSGNKPCTDRILEYGIKRVFLGTLEPEDFVNCTGVSKLKEKGVEIITVEGFAEKCLKAAKRGH